MRTNPILIIALYIFVPAIAAAQTVSFGIRGEFHTLKALVPGGFSGDAVFYDASSRYGIGPTFEIGLPRQFAIEFDALRSQQGYHSEFALISATQFTRHDFVTDTTGRAWKFPVIAKRYFNWSRSFRPYPEIGVSFRHVNGITTFEETTVMSIVCSVCVPTVTSGTMPALGLLHPWTAGIILGGGVDIPWKHFHFQPEIRYTYWPASSFKGNSFESNSNDLDIVIGLTFGK